MATVAGCPTMSTFLHVPMINVVRGSNQKTPAAQMGGAQFYDCGFQTDQNGNWLCRRPGSFDNNLIFKDAAAALFWIAISIGCLLDLEPCAEYQMQNTNHFLNAVSAIEQEGGVFCGELLPGEAQPVPTNNQKIQAYVTIRARTWFKNTSVELQKQDKDAMLFMNESLANFWCVSNGVQLCTVAEPHPNVATFVKKDVFATVAEVESYEKMMTDFMFKPALANYENSRESLMKCLTNGNETLKVIRRIRLQHSNASKSPLPSFGDVENALQTVQTFWKEKKELDNNEAGGEVLFSHDPSRELANCNLATIDQGVAFLDNLKRDLELFGSGRHIIPLFDFWQQFFFALNGRLTNDELHDLTVVQALDKLVACNVLKGTERNRIKSSWNELLKKHYGALTQHYLRLKEDPNAILLNCMENENPETIPEELDPVGTMVMHVLNLGDDPNSKGIFIDLVENWIGKFVGGIFKENGVAHDKLWNPHALFCDRVVPRMTISSLGSLWRRQDKRRIIGAQLEDPESLIRTLLSSRANFCGRELPDGRFFKEKGAVVDFDLVGALRETVSSFLIGKVDIYPEGMDKKLMPAVDFGFKEQIGGEQERQSMESAIQVSRGSVARDLISLKQQMPPREKYSYLPPLPGQEKVFFILFSFFFFFFSFDHYSFILFIFK